MTTEQTETTEKPEQIEPPAIVVEFADYLKSERHFADSTAESRSFDLVQFVSYMESQSKDQSKDVSIETKDKRALLVEATTGSINAFLDFLKEEKHPKDPAKKKYSKATIAKKLAALRSFYKFLVKRNHRNEDPTKPIKPPKVDKKLPRFLEYEEVKRLLNAPEINTFAGARDRAILETLYSTGMRVSELVALNMDCIDFLGEVVHIRPKKKKERIAPIGSSALQTIQHYMAYRNKRAQSAGNFDSTVLFVSDKGKRLSTRYVREITKKHVIKAGLDSDICPHTLRHSFAVHMISNGADKRSVAELLGHQQLTYVDIYGHLAERRSHSIRIK